MTVEEAKHSTAQHIITRALGTEDDSPPDLAEFPAEPGDILLLTTDGVLRHLEDPQIHDLMANSGSLQAACDTLIDSALDAGGEDNATCLLIGVKSKTAAILSAIATVRPCASATLECFATRLDNLRGNPHGNKDCWCNWRRHDGQRHRPCVCQRLCSDAAKWSSAFSTAGWRPSARISTAKSRRRRSRQQRRRPRSPGFTDAGPHAAGRRATSSSRRRPSGSRSSGIFRDSTTAAGRK